MSVDVGLKIAGRLLGAIFAGLRAERCEEGSVVSREEKFAMFEDEKLGGGTSIFFLEVGTVKRERARPEWD